MSAERTTPSLRDRLKAATRESILDAAEVVLGRDGIRDSHIEKIAEVAGVSVGTIYNYFQNRDDLLMALVERRREEMATAFDAILDAASSRAFEDVLFDCVRTGLEHAQRHRALFSVIFDGAAHSEFAAIRCRRTPPPGMAERGARLVRIGVESRALREVDATLYPMFFGSIMRAHVMHEVDGVPPDDLPARARAIVRFFLYGAGARP